MEQTNQTYAVEKHFNSKKHVGFALSVNIQHINKDTVISLKT